MSHWSDADLTRRAIKLTADLDLRCPNCGEENAPHSLRIQTEERGRTVCDTCGHSAPRQLFERKASR